MALARQSAHWQIPSIPSIRTIKSTLRVLSNIYRLLEFVCCVFSNIHRLLVFSIGRCQVIAASRKQEARSKKQEASSKKQEASSNKQEASSKKQEARSKKQDSPAATVYLQSSPHQSFSLLFAIVAAPIVVTSAICNRRRTTRFSIPLSTTRDLDRTSPGCACNP
jgi:hypothetical protein